MLDGDFNTVFAGSVRSYVLRVYLTISLGVLIDLDLTAANRLLVDERVDRELTFLDAVISASSYEC